MESISELRTGDILHCSSDGFIGKAIKWFTKSEFSHTAVVVECWGQIYVVDAQKDGVNPRPLDAWLEKYQYDIIVARKNTGPRDPKAFSIRAFTKVGHTGYDFASLIFRHPWAIITGQWMKSDKSKHRMVCSEFVAWLFNIEFSFRITPKVMHTYTLEHDFTHYNFILSK